MQNEIWVFFQENQKCDRNVVSVCGVRVVGVCGVCVARVCGVVCVIFNFKIQFYLKFQIKLFRFVLETIRTGAMRVIHLSLYCTVLPEFYTWKSNKLTTVGNKTVKCSMPFLWASRSAIIAEAFLSAHTSTIRDLIKNTVFIP